MPFILTFLGFYMTLMSSLCFQSPKRFEQLFKLQVWDWICDIKHKSRNSTATLCLKCILLLSQLFFLTDWSINRKWIHSNFYNWLVFKGMKVSGKTVIIYCFHLLRSEDLLLLSLLYYCKLNTFGFFLSGWTKQANWI